MEGNRDQAQLARDRRGPNSKPKLLPHEYHAALNSGPVYRLDSGLSPSEAQGEQGRAGAFEHYQPTSFAADPQRPDSLARSNQLGGFLGNAELREGLEAALQLETHARFDACFHSLDSLRGPAGDAEEFGVERGALLLTARLNFPQILRTLFPAHQ